MADTVIGRRLIDKIRELDDDQKQRVLEFIDDLGEPKLSLGEWLIQAESQNTQYKAKYGKDNVINSVALLDEAREERLSDIMGGS